MGRTVRLLASTGNSLFYCFQIPHSIGGIAGYHSQLTKSLTGHAANTTTTVIRYGSSTSSTSTPPAKPPQSGNSAKSQNYLHSMPTSSVRSLDDKGNPTSFYFQDLNVKRAVGRQKQAKPPNWDSLLFGHVFSDHWLTAAWHLDSGWSNPHIGPLQALSLHPAAKVFQYGIEIFEGMKAFRGVDNKIRLFMPELNIERMIRTAERCTLPTFDGAEFSKCLIELLRLDVDWIPTSTTASMYIRPTMIATDATLGVAPSDSALMYVLCSPVSAYYSTGFKPITLWADPSFCRAWPGGAGAFKMGANYAPTLIANKEAYKNGAQQVLWLFGPDHQLTEAGTMNVLIVWRNEAGDLELVTPPLSSGLILPGVTRAGLLKLCGEWPDFCNVIERDISMEDIRKAVKENRMLEMFGTGTAAVVSPVEKILYKNNDGSIEEIFIPTMQQKESVMQLLYNTLADIQYGRVARPDLAPVIIE